MYIPSTRLARLLLLLLFIIEVGEEAKGKKKERLVFFANTNRGS